MSRVTIRLGAVLAAGLLVAACSGSGSSTVPTPATTPTTTTPAATPTTIAGLEITGTGGAWKGLTLVAVAVAIGLALALVASRRQPRSQRFRVPEPRPDPDPDLRRDFHHRPDPDPPPPRRAPTEFPPTIGEAQPSADAEPLLQHSATAPPDLMIHAGRIERKGGRPLVIRAASLRGVASRLEEKERQDAYSFLARGQHLVVAVADGVGSLPDSGIAARVAGRNVCVRVQQSLESHAKLDDGAIRKAFESSAWDIVLAARQRADNAQLSAQDALRSMATTLVIGIIDHHGRDSAHLTVARVGDSSAWLLRGGEAQPLWDDAETGALLDTKTVALPGFGDEGVEILRRSLDPEDVLILATDGFANGWGTGVGDVADYFKLDWRRPPEPITFAGQVGYRRRTFDDDRTVIAVWA